LYVQNIEISCIDKRLLKERKKMYGMDILNYGTGGKDANELV
jgi:hypothetical protein